MGYLAVFATFTEPAPGSALYLDGGIVVCSQNLTSPRHAFFDDYFSRKRPIRFSKGYSEGEYWGYYSCSEEEVKLFTLAKQLPENSKLWHEVRRKLLQGCDLEDLIQTLEVCILVFQSSLLFESH